MLSSEDASVASKFVNRILNLNSRSASSGMYVVSSIILVIIIFFFRHDSICSVLLWSCSYFLVKFTGIIFLCFSPDVLVFFHVYFS